MIRSKVPLAVCVLLFGDDGESHMNLCWARHVWPLVT